MSTAFRFILLAAMLAGPLAAIGQVRAGDGRFVGEAHRYANGSGLVLAISVQRR